jgi:hypothetical protein
MKLNIMNWVHSNQSALFMIRTGAPTVMAATTKIMTFQ